MDTTILRYVVIAVALFIAYRIITRLLNRPNREFWNFYKEILHSSKYKVKGHFEE
jgi:hypothetical protein